MTIFGLIRHGVTDWNQQGRIQGQQDVPLNEEGRKQAELLGKRLEDESWDFIFSSDMKRAKETADIIAGHMGKKVEAVDPRLRERTFGRLDGTTEDERVSQWGQDWINTDFGGEEPEDVIERSYAFLDELAQKYPEKKILIITHGAVIALLLEYLFPNIGYSSLRNTCLNVIEKNETGWACRLYNCTKHLDHKRYVKP